MARRIFADVADRDTLRRWFSALNTNAEALRLEAGSLLQGGKPGRALALAVLALEETVKAAHIADLDEEHRQSGLPFVVDAETLARWTQHSGKLPSAMLATIQERRPDLFALFTPADAFDGLATQDLDEHDPRRLVVELYAGIRARARNLNTLKQRGLYVDVVDGRVTGPEDVEPELAGGVLEAAEICAQGLHDRVSDAATRLGSGPLDGA